MSKVRHKLEERAIIFSRRTFGVGRSWAGALSLFLSLPLHAATISWNGSASGDWFNAANWTPAQVPTPADDVVIDLNATVSASGATSIAFATLTLGDAAVNFAPTLRLSAAESTNGSVTIHRGAKLQHDTNQQIVFGALSLRPGGTLTHTANGSARSFLINLNVIGNFDLQAGATIAANALGYAGGTDYQVAGKGPGGGGSSANGDGAGGGHGGKGGPGSAGALGGLSYDSATSPTDLGSGGGGTHGTSGGSGGGAALIAVGGVFSLNGTISAGGGNGAVNSSGYYSSGGGAGGTVNITAASFNGSGQVLANGGAGVSGFAAHGGGGGGGRISIVVTGNDSSDLNLQANSGDGGGTGPTGGGAGVIAVKTPGGTDYNLSIGDLTAAPRSGTGVVDSSPTFSTVTVYNSIVAFDAGSNVALRSLVVAGGARITGNNFSFGAVAPLVVRPGGALQITANNLTFPAGSSIEVQAGGSLGFAAAAVSGGVLKVRNGGTFRQLNTQTINFDSVSVEPGGVITHAANASARSAVLNLNVAGNFDLPAGASIAVSGMGYAGGSDYQVAGKGPGGGGSSANGDGAGGGHGGKGGQGSGGAPGGLSYDSAASPTDLGSGGGGTHGTSGGSGGGAALIAVGGAFSLNGTISAGGGNGAVNSSGYYSSGGGAGGTVNITAASFNGSGQVLANGGAGISGFAAHGGGGGGGIVVLTGCNSGLLMSGATGGASGGAGAAAGGAGSVNRVPGLNCPPPPPSPSNLAVTKAELASLTAVWSSTVAAISYTLQISSDPAFASAISATTSGTSITVTGLQLRTVYYLRVLASNNSGNSAYSPSISATTLINPANISWIGGSDSNWFNGANWSPALIPHSVDAVAINASTTVVIGPGFPAAFSSLVLGDGSGNTAPILKVSGAIFASGSLLIHRNATLQQDSTQQLTLGQITVAAGGALSADGAGFAPGAGPGAGLTVPELFGGGSGSGGGYGGRGGRGINGGNIGPDGNVVEGGGAYGSLTQPSDLGSGGGAIVGGHNVLLVPGGSGGGKLKIVAGTLRVDGRISADGRPGGVSDFWQDRGGGGSGGTVLITVERLEGAGVIKADGGASSPRGLKNGGGGSGGRIAISYGTSVFTGSVTARGGLGRQYGGAGTVVYGPELRIDNGVSGGSTTISAGAYGFQQVSIGSHAIVEMEAGASLNAGSFLTQGNSTFTNRGSLTVTAAAATTGGSVLRQLSGTLSAPRLEARTGGLFGYDGGTLSAREAEAASGGVLSLNARLELARLRVAPGGVVTHDVGDADFDLVVAETLTIEPGGRVSVDGAGHAPGAGPGAGATVTEAFGIGKGSGGGYGGQGGAGTQPGGFPYGSLAQPSDLGSGGGGITGGHGVMLVPGGRGGGKLRISAGTLRVDGRISADGLPGGESGFWQDRGGGGSGGSVLISVQRLEGAGVISANGGAASPRGFLNGGGGGGGRVALYYSTKVGSQTLVAVGGMGGENGSPGTILDNGVLHGTMAGSSAASAFSQMREGVAATKTLGETLSAQLLNFAGATSTGTPAGTFSLAELRVVLVKTGPFANKGFFRGRYALSIPAGESLPGDWEGMAYFAAGDSRRLLLKGVLKGRIQGVLDGSLTESAVGSGVFDRLTANCRLVQVGNVIGASSIYISGIGSVLETVQHPGTMLNFLQATQAGEVGGYYSTPVDIVFSLLRVDSPGNPYYGEGFFAAAYESPLGPGQGWAYAAASGEGARLAGTFEQSLKGLMEGVLTVNSPRSLLLTLRNLDAGLPLQGEVTVSLAPAGNAPIGGVATVIIEVRNDGYAVAEGVTVVAVAPERSRFLSATGDHKTYNVTHWRDNQYAPKPFIRWDFAAVPARSSQKMSYQVRLSPATPSSVRAEIDVRAITTDWANNIFAGYHIGETP